MSLENDKTQIEDITRVEKSEEHTEGIPTLKTFRGCKVLKELPARGGEADNYILECNGIKAFLKLYRKGLSPKVDLKRIQEISRSYREHLVEIYDTGYDQQTGRYYEIMEYIEHGDLRSLLNQIKGKTIDKKERIIDKVVSEIAEALNVLHKNNIIHRDLKPANILIRDKDKLDLVLTDFGIARALEEDLSKVQTTGFKGTTHYMAPEELSGYFGKEIDWWHLGVIVYELVFGKHPFEGLTDKVVINALVTKGIEIPQGIPEKYSVLLKGLLTKDYKKRWGYEQVKRWLSGDLNIEVYYEQAETRVEEDYEEKEWMKYGISKETNWRKLGLSPIETNSFIKAGFGFNEAKKWVDAGWRSGELAKRWYNAGFRPEESYVFEKLGLSPKQAGQIKNIGLTAYDLKPLIGAEIELIEEFINFIEEGGKTLSFEPLRKLVKELSLWRKEGFTIKEAYEWIRYGFSSQEAKMWKVAKFDLQNAIRWRKLGFNTEEAKEWIKEGFSPEEAQKWKTLNFSPKEAKEWYGVEPNPQNAIRWRKLGFNTEEAKEWIKEGFSPEEAQKWKTLNFSPKEAKEWYGVEPNPQNAIRWRKLGFNTEEAKEWIKEGFSPEEAQKWKTLNFSPKEAKEWSGTGFDPVEVRIIQELNLSLEENGKTLSFEPLRRLVKELSLWRKEGFTIKEAYEWIRYDFSIQEAKMWKAAEFDPQNAIKWQKLGFNTEEAKEWIKEGFSPEEAQKWKTLNFSPKEAKEWYGVEPNPQNAIRWRKLGFNIKEAKEWIKEGFSPEEAQKWKTLNFSPKEAKEWYGVEPNPQNAIKWQKLGFNIKEAKEWIKEGFSPEEAQKWKTLNFSPKEAKEWYGVEPNPQNAIKWQKLGFNIKEAKEWIKEGFSPEEAQKWKTLNFSPKEAKEWKTEGFSIKEAEKWKALGFSPKRAKEFVKDGFTPGEAKFIEIIAIVVYSISIYLFVYYKFRLNSLWTEMFVLFVAYFIGLYFIFPIIEWLIRKTIKMLKIFSEA